MYDTYIDTLTTGEHFHPPAKFTPHIVAIMIVFKTVIFFFSVINLLIIAPRQLGGDVDTRARGDYYVSLNACVDWEFVAVKWEWTEKKV